MTDRLEKVEERKKRGQDSEVNFFIPGKVGKYSHLLLLTLKVSPRPKSKNGRELERCCRKPDHDRGTKRQAKMSGKIGNKSQRKADYSGKTKLWRPEPGKRKYQSGRGSRDSDWFVYHFLSSSLAENYEYAHDRSGWQDELFLEVRVEKAFGRKDEIPKIWYSRATFDPRESAAFPECGLRSRMLTSLGSSNLPWRGDPLMSLATLLFIIQSKILPRFKFNRAFRVVSRKYKRSLGARPMFYLAIPFRISWITSSFA